MAVIEAEHGLQPGVLTRAAFAPALLDSAITGEITRARWVETVGRTVGNTEAAAEWLAVMGTVDGAMLVEVAALRSAGIGVAVLTNGTDTIPDEMEALGLVDLFDGIFNSAQIGYAKPDRRAFEHVCRELDVDPSAVFFTDDSASKLRGAVEIGITARRFTGVEPFQRHLEEFGLNP